MVPESQTAEYDKGKGGYCRKDDKRCQMSRKIPKKKGQWACTALGPRGKLSLWIQVSSVLSAPFSSLTKIMWVFKPCSPCWPAPLQTAALYNSRLATWKGHTDGASAVASEHQLNAIKGHFYPRESVPTSCSPTGVNSSQHGGFSAEWHYSQQTFHLLQRGQRYSHSGFLLMLSELFGFTISCPWTSERLNEKSVSHCFLKDYFCEFLNSVDKNRRE